MADDKYFLFAGRKVPISTDHNVYLYQNMDNNGGPSAYTPEETLTPEEVMSLQNMTAAGRCWSFRTGFNALNNQFMKVNRAELDRLGEHIWQVALHYDVTPDAKKAYHVLCMRGLSTHFDIDYNGDLYQFVDPYHRAIATGANNDHSVAIDVNNPFYPEQQQTEPSGVRDIIQGTIHGHMVTMLGFTEAQYETLIALLKAFITPVKIPGEPDWIPLPAFAAQAFPPMNAEGEVVQTMLKDSIGFHGFLGHFHCTTDKIDPGPAFDWKRVLSGLKGKRNSMPVLLESMMSRNLSEVAINQVKKYFDAYYSAIENSNGGWFPVGLSQAWHSGVHIPGQPGSEVLCMFDGTIVAMRFCRTVDLGDPSFVLVRHEKVEPGPDGKDISLYWYSLYMHLAPFENEKQLKKTSWVGELLGSDMAMPDKIRFEVPDPVYAEERGIPIVDDATNPVKNHDAILNNFYRGHILKTNIPVKSGDLLGFVGLFGPRPEAVTRQVHIEVFSTENSSLFARYGVRDDVWIDVEGDDAKSNLIDIKRVIDPILNSRFASDSKAVYLKSSEIQQFYLTAPERYDHRRMVCYHRSEWSPTVDWTNTAVSAVGWQWETQAAFANWLLTWLPFQWMTKEIVKYLSFPENACFYTYHPIYLLEQLNMSYSGELPPTTAEEADQEARNKAESDYKKNMDELKDLNAKAKRGELKDPRLIERRNELQANLDDDYEIGMASLDRVVDYDYEYDKKFNVQEPGEWEPPESEL